MPRNMFGDIVEPSIKVGSKKNWYTVPLSIIMHAAIIGAVLIIPMMAVDALPTPPEMMGAFAGIHEVNVYGVEVPGREGRAGMAAIVCAPDLDLTALRSYLAAHLPDYGRPVFLRIRGEIDVTATFKQRKIGLVKDGFDPASIADAIYFDDPRTHAYVRLDTTLYEEIVSGRVRL